MTQRAEVRGGRSEGSFRHDGRAGRSPGPAGCATAKAEGRMSDDNSDILVWSYRSSALPCGG
jgi:hypothetical protein